VLDRPGLADRLLVKVGSESTDDPFDMFRCRHGRPEVNPVVLRLGIEIAFLVTVARPDRLHHLDVSGRPDAGKTLSEMQ
jgi:hypothetical protein